MIQPNGACQFSPCRSYRYELWRTWPTGDSFDFGSAPGVTDTRANQYLMMIGLNPSTADETLNDPTVRRCIDFAKRWGFGALCMTNIFAWRDTKPKGMKQAPDPIGPLNDSTLSRLATGAGLVVAAWGKHGLYRDRQAEVCRLLAETPLKCFKRNRDGTPMHPLYQAANVQLLDFSL